MRAHALVLRLLCLTLLALGGPLAALGQDKHFSLADARLAATPQARQWLKYLVSCALNADQVLLARQGDEHHEFPGGIGLAPEWRSRGMTLQEQRWVSACLLARTNHFGATVKISLRAPFTSPVEALHTPQPGDERYPIEEGTFFGNLFSSSREAYVCGPRHDAAMRALIEAQKRVCALPLASDAGSGETACAMVHVGPCTAQAFEQNGVRYTEAISIFLPMQASDLDAGR
jgi:hypothetical protein